MKEAPLQLNIHVVRIYNLNLRISRQLSLTVIRQMNNLDQLCP